MLFAGGGCDTCHQPAKDGKVVLVEDDSRKLCLTCHEDKGKEIESAKVQHPGAQGDCITCHDPHAGKAPGFLRPDPVAACTGCHSDVAALHAKKFPQELHADLPQRRARSQDLLNRRTRTPLAAGCFPRVFVIIGLPSCGTSFWKSWARSSIWQSN